MSTLQEVLIQHRDELKKLAAEAEAQIEAAEKGNDRFRWKRIRRNIIEATAHLNEVLYQMGRM